MYLRLICEQGVFKLKASLGARLYRMAYGVKMELFIFVMVAYYSGRFQMTVTGLW